MSVLVGLGLLAWGLQPAEQVHLQLVGGEEMVGRVSDATPGVLRLTTEQGLREVPVALVEEAIIEGRTLDAQGLEEEIIGMLQVEMERWEGTAMPTPFWTGAASAVWAGGGQAALRQWDRAGAYAVTDLVCVGLAAWFLLKEESPGQAVPLLAFSLLFKGYSAAEARSDAKRRRRVYTLLKSEASDPGSDDLLP